MIWALVYLLMAQQSIGVIQPIAVFDSREACEQVLLSVRSSPTPKHVDREGGACIALPERVRPMIGA